MQELTTTATLVEYGTFEGGSAITAVLARSELEAALHADESAQLWFEFGRDEDEETRRLTIEVTSTDVEEMLRLSTGDDVVLALDAGTVGGLFDEPDVEAHGMRGALAIAVTAAAIIAPTGLAAAPQTASAAATPQVSSQVSSQVSPQVSSLAAEAQISSLAATPQVSGQVARAAAKAQVKGLAAKTQVSKSLVVKAGGVILRGGIVR